MKKLFNMLKSIKSRGKLFEKKSYSQCGEDMIVDFIFRVRRGADYKPSFIDIGANDPFKLSNTAYFSDMGSKGVNIEPNPILHRKIQKYRKNDVNLNIGIGSASDDLDFYIMNSDTMSTFSKENAEDLSEKHGFKIVDVKKIPVKPLMAVINEYCDGIFPDFLSLDAEGLDYEILKSIDYKISSPKVICVETITYETNGRGIKETEIIDLLKNNGYMIFADTFINTIFVRNDFWLEK